MKRVAVYCGSSSGASPAYIEGAVALGQELVKRGISLVYGGASVGVMGAVADTVLQGNGQVIGVMPQLLIDREIAHQGLSEMYVVDNMHERKAKMAELADAFIVLPGGPGTMEEFFEVFTWAQIGIHQKPIGLLNVNQYYDPLTTFFNHMMKEQFLQEKYHAMLIVEPSSEELLNRFETYQAPSVKSYSK